MELFFQFGHGMKQLTLDFSDLWGGATVILSPRDIEPKQLIKWSSEFERHNVKCLFDPQCYFPKTNHKKLSQYDYWNNSMSTQLGAEDSYETTLIKKIIRYNDIAKTETFIIPAVMRKYNIDWMKAWKSNSDKLVKETNKLVTNKPVLLTLALPNELLLQHENIIEGIIDIASKFEVDGFYIVAEPTKQDYLVEEPLWLSNLIQLCAGLKLAGKKVVVGYANHQMLCLTLAGVDAIASGTFLNVRRFSNKFEDNEDVKRKSVWYYCPHALSEYKLTFLDIAYSNGVLNALKPDESLKSEYANILFSGAMPSSVSLKETLAFKHYLQCLREQIFNTQRLSYDETLSANEILLESAARRIELLERNGIFAQNRNFRDIIDVNRSAISRLNETRGFNLKYSWDSIVK